MTTRLTHDSATKMIVVGAEIVATLRHRGAGRLGPSVNDDARRLAFSVRIDDADRFGVLQPRGFGCSRGKNVCHPERSEGSRVSRPRGLVRADDDPPDGSG